MRSRSRGPNGFGNQSGKASLIRIRLKARLVILGVSFQVHFFCPVSTSSPSTARFFIGGPRQVVPSEDYSHRPPRCAGF